MNSEIIIVDDASTDDTPGRLAKLAGSEPRLRIIRNEKNLGFLASTNRGAQEANGDILLFLNNDTVLLPDWLPPLLRVFRDYPQAGAVGGKLLFHDGSLQEAGGCVFSDGSAANFGRGDINPDAALYNFVREVDYCSGALLATKRALFQELGGFDTRYLPAYYEDTDYCFKVREKGLRVYYQPASGIVHLEGGTAGTERYQVINHRKFVKRWADVLRSQPDRPIHFDLAAWHALALRSSESERQARRPLP